MTGPLAAFEPLHEPQTEAAADPLDRIAVRDYVREIEIGAFQPERGIRQRVRFNAVLEVAHHSAALDDDVDKVLSYDAIVDAIDAELAAERINLLETLAERIAARVLRHPLAVRLWLRIEKLDRIPGALGIEIVRRRVDPAAVVRPALGPGLPADEEEAPHPLVVFLPNATLRGAEPGPWLDVLAGQGKPVVIAVDLAPEPLPRTGVAPVDRRLRLLHIETNAWVLAARDPRCTVVASRTELEWSMRRGRISVWAPSKLVLDSPERPAAESAAGLAAWFAARFSAEALIVLGPEGELPPGARRAATPEELAAILSGS